MVYFGECCEDCLLRLVFMFPTQAGVPCAWTSDSQRILLDNFDAIHNSPSHLYHSALPLCPSSSWLHECYSSELSLEVKVVRGPLAGWGMCSRTVLLDHSPQTLSYWNNAVAVGTTHRDILILDAITGSQTAVLPGHTDEVNSLTFSADGKSLVSGSDDTTVKLWDVQTGGVVKTFHGHTNKILSVSISADHTTIASGSQDETLRLWNIEMGECHHIIDQNYTVFCASFSPTDPQCLISVYDTTAQCWDINGQKVGPNFAGDKIAFSPDGTQFTTYQQDDVIVQNINSGVIVVKFSAVNSRFSPCCFSPDGKLVAVATSYNVCVWDITGSDPHLVETFIGHANHITFIAFSSPTTLISASQDKSVKFWQVGASSTDPVVIDPKSMPLTLASTKSIALEVKNGTIIPGGLDGVTKTWGISTGLCTGSLQIPAGDSHHSNIQLIDSKLVFVWCAVGKIHIWDAEKGELLLSMNVPGSDLKDLRVSGDGSKIFCLYGRLIQVWDIWTGKAVGKVRPQNDPTGILATDGSKVWIEGRSGYDAYVHGWDFGIPGSSPVKLPNKLSDMLHLSDTMVWETNVSRMKDVVTGKVILQLPERFGKVVHVQWGGHYLVISFRSKEVLILDFSHMLL